MTNRKKSIVATLMVIFFVCSVYFGYLGARTYISLGDFRSDEKVDSLDKASKDENINIVVAGIDSGKFLNDKVRNERGRTDTLMVASINPKTKAVRILSIPRDTRVEIPGRGKEKINHAHAYGGMDLTVKTIQNFLGIPIHHYIKIDFEAFIALVDAIGGVTIEIKPSDLQGVINQDSRVKLTPGTHQLDSEHAFQYVRIRNSDIGRVERQQKFIKAVMKDTLQVSNLFKITSIVENVAPHVDTDLTAYKMIDLAKEVKGFNSEALETEILPGKSAYVDGGSYWIADEAKKQELVEKFFK